MAERVGADGSVLATDIDTTHLEPLGGGVLEVRRHDLRRDDLPVESFDLVHERSVLSWLGASDALERLVAAVAPGGWLVVEDFDWATGGPGDDAPAVAKAYEAILELIESVGYDRRYGRTLLLALERWGLEETGSGGRAYILRGGSPGTALRPFLDACSARGTPGLWSADGARVRRDPSVPQRSRKPRSHPGAFAARGRKPA